jgi:hypothetical protein
LTLTAMEQMDSQTHIVVDTWLQFQMDRSSKLSAFNLAWVVRHCLWMVQYIVLIASVLIQGVCLTRTVKLTNLLMEWTSVALRWFHRTCRHSLQEHSLSAFQAVKTMWIWILKDWWWELVVWDLIVRE